MSFLVISITVFFNSVFFDYLFKSNQTQVENLKHNAVTIYHVKFLVISSLEYLVSYKNIKLADNEFKTGAKN